MGKVQEVIQEALDAGAFLSLHRFDGPEALTSRGWTKLNTVEEGAYYPLQIELTIELLSNAIYNDSVEIGLQTALKRLTAAQQASFAQFQQKYGEQETLDGLSVEDIVSNDGFHQVFSLFHQFVLYNEDPFDYFHGEQTEYDAEALPIVIEECFANILAMDKKYGTSHTSMHIGEEAQYILTDDTLWNVEYLLSAPTQYEVFKTIFGYLMLEELEMKAALHEVRYIGLWNPVMGRVYRMAVDDLPRNRIQPLQDAITARQSS